MIGEQDLPQWAQAVAVQTEQSPGTHIVFSAGKVRIAYDYAGQAVEEDFYCAVQQMSFLAAGRMMYNQNGERAHAMRAARGQLDQSTPIMQIIVTSVRVNLQWLNKYTQVWQALYQMQMERIKAAGRMSQIIS